MEKKLGEFTLYEVKAICEKSKECKSCPFYSGVDKDAQRCLVRQKTKYDLEIVTRGIEK